MPLANRSSFPPSPTAKKGWPWEAVPLTQNAAVGATDQLKISIVTPSFNQGSFIEQTIRSVLLQNYVNIEYIIIDGGSSDNTLQIINKYEPWLAYWQSENDQGQADAIKNGFQIASGQIFAWLNSDDYYQPGAFNRINDFFQSRPDLIFASGDVNIVDEKSRFIRRIFALYPSRFFAANYGKHGWPQQGCFWRQEAYQQAGGIDSRFDFCMDKDLFIRLISVGKGKRLPGQPIANFRVHQSAKSTTMLTTAQQETETIIKKYGQRKWSSRPKLMRILWWLFRKQAALRKRVIQYTKLEY